MNELNYMMVYDDYLAHHGIKGQKWGIRRYQNPDGSLTEEGIQRYGVSKLSERNNRNNKFGRKFVMGEIGGAPGIALGALAMHPVGNKAFGTHREDRLKRKIEKIKKNKKNYDSDEKYNKKLNRVTEKYNYQKGVNTRREKYDSNVSTGARLVGELFVPGRRYYTNMRSEGFSKARSVVSTILRTLPPIAIPTILVDHYSKTEKRGAKYRDWAW